MGSPESATQASLLVIQHAAKCCPSGTAQVELDDPPLWRVMARDWLIFRWSLQVVLPVVSLTKRLIVFPVFRRAASFRRRQDWPTSSTQRDEGLFSFVASFGRHSDQCVQKQGYRQTIL
jgi:hypothetical protein